MHTSSPPVVVFADIDDVPLGIDEGHRRLPALLATLAAERIMLVFCSSRTRAEIEGFRQSVGVFHPFVCEDGAAVFVPSRYFGSEMYNARAVGGYQAIEFGLPYDAVVATVRRHAQQLRVDVRGFADMSIEEVARECGLSLLAARLAKLREYSEPFRLPQAHPAAEARLVRALASSGINCLRRGAFLNAVSVDGPAAAVSVLTTLYRSAFGAILTTATGRGAAAFAGRVHIDLDAVEAGVSNGGETIGWIERIVTRVRTLRQRGDEPARLPIGA
jgi:mannosyl-3-phosphoglycerate phosphatase